MEDFEQLNKYEDDEEENEVERAARLEVEDLERQIAQKKCTLESLEASWKAAEYRRRAEEARRTLKQMQEQINMQQ